MITFYLTDSERYLFLVAENRDDEKNMHLLENHLNRVPEFCYMPQYKGIPYKEEFLYNRVNNVGHRVWYAAIGLCQEICNFFRKYNISYQGIVASAFKREMIPFEEFKKVVDSWNLKYTPREYQYEAAYKVLCWKQSISEIATRAGKTLIAYIIFRYLMECQGAKNILMVVPSVQLVKQGFSDFSDYAEFFKTECIWAGGSEVESSNLTIGTFQSLIKKLDRNSPKYNPAWFDKFDVVFVDEVHRATASQVRTIINQPFFTKCKLVYGMTGTLPKPDTIERFTLAALLGTKIQEITAKELMDDGYISDLIIHQVHIKYDMPDKINKLYVDAGEYLLSDYGKHKELLAEPHYLYKYKKTLPPGIAIAKQRLGNNTESYKNYLIDLIKESDSTNALLLERMVIHDLDDRVEYLKNIIAERVSNNGNWLVLTHHKEYTQHVCKELTNCFPEKKVYKIDSNVSVKKRTDIVNGMKNGNAILVASYGCMSTGMTLPNLCYGVLFESFKSSVVNIQSIGRGLGKTDGKSKYELWDIVDMLPTKKIDSQGRERAKIYKDNSYNYDIIKVNFRENNNHPELDLFH